MPTIARVHRSVRETAEQDPVEQQAEQRREDEHRDDQRRHDRDVLPDVQLVVEVRDRERDGAVREVEDARGLVREHQTRRPSARRSHPSPLPR